MQMPMNMAQPVRIRPMTAIMTIEAASLAARHCQRERQREWERECPTCASDQSRLHTLTPAHTRIQAAHQWQDPLTTRWMQPAAMATPPHLQLHQRQHSYIWQAVPESQTDCLLSSCSESLRRAASGAARCSSWRALHVPQRFNTFCHATFAVLLYIVLQTSFRVATARCLFVLSYSLMPLLICKSPIGLRKTSLTRLPRGLNSSPHDLSSSNDDLNSRRTAPPLAALIKRAAMTSYRLKAGDHRTR